jgi:integrase
MGMALNPQHIRVSLTARERPQLHPKNPKGVRGIEVKIRPLGGPPSNSEPALALHCQRVLAIPSKRFERGPVEFLTEEETAALVAAPDPGSWIGRRDKALLLVAVQTGLRNSEITSLRRQVSVAEWISV